MSQPQCRFKAAIQPGGCWLHKGAFITRPALQPALLGGPLGARGASGRDTWSSGTGRMPRAWGLGERRGGMGVSGSFHSCSGTEPVTSTSPSCPPLSRRPPNPPSGTPTVKHSGHGWGREGQQGPQWASGLGQALPLITSSRSSEEAGCWPGPRTAVQAKPSNPRPPKPLFFF